MSNITTFNFQSHDVRIVDQDGHQWFVLRDLLDAIGTSTPTTAAIESIEQGLGKGFTNGIPLQTAGGKQNVVVIAESAATLLLSRSNTEQGRALNRFIHVEVLPSIRKTGGYQVPVKSTTIQPAKEFRALFGIARLIGLDKNAAAISANQAVTKITGTNLLEALGQTHLENKEQELFFTPTELGREIGVSGRAFNMLLAEAGLQTKQGEAWVPTQAAEGFFRVLDTGKRHGNGAMVQQIKWAKQTCNLIPAFG